jgi:hypothetical protein
MTYNFEIIDCHVVFEGIRDLLTWHSNNKTAGPDAYIAFEETIYEWCVDSLGYFPEFTNAAHPSRHIGYLFKSPEDAVMFRFKWL